MADLSHITRWLQAEDDELLYEADEAAREPEAPRVPAAAPHTIVVMAADLRDRVWRHAILTPVVWDSAPWEEAPALRVCETVLPAAGCPCGAYRFVRMHDAESRDMVARVRQAMTDNASSPP